MDIILSNSSGEPIYQQIVTQIKGHIMSGALASGDALPSMRLLAQQLRTVYRDLYRQIVLYDAVVVYILRIYESGEEYQIPYLKHDMTARRLDTNKLLRVLGELVQLYKALAGDDDGDLAAVLDSAELVYVHIALGKSKGVTGDHRDVVSLYVKISTAKLGVVVVHRSYRVKRMRDHRLDLSHLKHKAAL